MKICTICKVPKELEDFNKNKAKKDGLNNLCRECSNKKSKKYYLINTLEHRSKVAIRKEIVLKNNKEKFLNLLKESSCKDCGNKDHRTFEFDHLGDKYKNISDLLGAAYSWKVIEEEINKCDIVCANCHRIRTFSRIDTYRNN